MDYSSVAESNEEIKAGTKPTSDTGFKLPAYTKCEVKILHLTDQILYLKNGSYSFYFLILSSLYEFLDLKRVLNGSQKLHY